MSCKKNSQWKITMLKRFNGDEQALHEHMASIGARGGAESTGGGFAADFIGKDGLTGPERAAKFGKIGGERSRRLKKVVQ